MTEFKDIFEWDHYSDQPHVIRDKNIKKKIYKKATIDQLKTIITTIFLSPLIVIYYFFIDKKTPKIKNYFGMSINLNKEPSLTKELIEELGCRVLLVRIPLSDIKNLDEYVSFIEQFNEYNVMVNILQDRKNIEDLELFEENLNSIFSSLPQIKTYQIANAINRKKWAFFTMDEYLKFFSTAKKLRDNAYPDIKLLGSSVIDFEYNYSIRTLFNLYPIKYDIFTSLLYVDRRGSPENTQMGFDLIKKIRLLYAIVSLSPKSENSIYITETNWPITKTAPYAPTSEKECVTLDEYSHYMIQYYLLTLSTGMVERVYWHQLIAPGYGLIDNRNGIKKYPAFQAYKTMVALLQDAQLVSFNFDNDLKYMKFQNRDTVEIYWSQNKLPPIYAKEKLNIYGEKFNNNKFMYVIT